MKTLDPMAVVETYKNKTWPTNEIRSVKPHDDAEHLTGECITGGKSGIHTGGAYLLNGYVYKPCDVRPSQNSPVHVFSDELAALLVAQGRDLFPKNWDVVEAYGRIFIVRPQGMLIPEHSGWDYLDRVRALWVERALLEFNAMGWEVGDHLALAVHSGPKYPIYQYDLSAAHPCHKADERNRALDLFQAAGMDYLYRLRCNGRDISSRYLLDPETEGMPWVYCSMKRPLWAGLKIPGMKAIYGEDRPSWATATPHAWIVTTEPIERDWLDRHEFEIAWFAPPHTW